MKTCNQLLKEAEQKGDGTTDVFSAELFLLLKVAETSSDLIKARHWLEFREAVGGVEPCEKAHEEAVKAWEQWLSECETTDPR